MKNTILILIFSTTFFGQSYCQQTPAFENNKRRSDSIAILEYQRISDSLLHLFDSINISLSKTTDTSSIKDEFDLKQIGWTNDFEKIFTPEQIYVLDSIIGNFEKETTIEIAIVTIDSSFIRKSDFDDAVGTIGRIWGVGKKEKNNGIIIGISTSLRKIRISNGYGIENKLTDVETKKIIEELIIPEFRQAKFYEGVRKALFAIISRLR